MTIFSDYLKKKHACEAAVVWVGNRTAAQAWRDCKRVDWMFFLLRQLALHNDCRLRYFAADTAERAWPHITSEKTKLAVAWAIGAVRRGDAEEMDAAAASIINTDHLFSASNHAVKTAISALGMYPSLVAVAALDAATYAACAASISPQVAVDAEREAQSDSLRKYFPAAEIERLVKKKSIQD